MSRVKAQKELALLRKQLDKTYDRRRIRDTGVVTEVIRDRITDANGQVLEGGKVRKIKFTASGLTDQTARVPDGTAVSVGDAIHVTRSANGVVRPDWEFLRVVRTKSALGAARDDDRHVSTPVGFSVADSSVYAPVPGGNTKAWVELTWTPNPAHEGVDLYLIAYKIDGETVWREIPDDAPNLRIRDLEVSTTYNFRIRAVNGHGVPSAWSSIISYTTGADTTQPTPPGGEEGDPVTGLSADFTGLNCVIKWNDVVLTDDFSHYEIKIYNDNTEALLYRTVTRRASSYTYTYDDNQEDGSGTADPTLYVKVRAVDYTGNTNDWATVEATNAAPAQVSGQTYDWDNNDLHIWWTAPTFFTTPDMAYYRVRIYTSVGGTLLRDVGVTNHPAYNYTADMNRADNTKAATGADIDTSLYIILNAVDAFGQSGTDTTITATKSTLSAPTNLAWGFGDGGTLVVVWLGTENPQLDKYKIVVTGAGGSFTYYQRAIIFTYPYQQNVEDHGSPGDPTLTVDVSWIDIYGQESPSAQVTPSNSAPGAPSGLAATGGFEQIIVTWNRGVNNDTKHFKLYADQSGAGFTPDDSTNLVFTGLATEYSHSVGYSETWYYKIKEVDIFDQASTASSAVSATSHDIDTNTPSAPTNLALTSDIEEIYSGDFQGVIYASWDAPAGSPAAFQYELRWKLSTESTYEYKKTAAETTTDSIHGLIPAKTYDVNVRALSRYGKASAWYNSGIDEQETITNDTSAPTEISDLAATAGPLKVTLSWTSPGESDAWRIFIYRNTSNTHVGEAQVALLPCKPGEEQQYVDQFNTTSYPFTPGTTYYYWLKVADRAGNVSGYSNGVSKAPDSIASDEINDPSLLGWQFDGPFSASDYNTVAWGVGTLRFSDGTTHSILAGNTGAMSALTYVYFDENVSTTTLQTTTTASDAVGSGKLLIGVAENNSDSGKDATFQVFGGSGGQHPSITASQVVANTITANEIAANTITASEIAAGTITGTEISASATIVAGTGNNVGVLDGADATYRIYAGHATPASAPFRVTQAGALTATNATITGSITATTGAIGGWSIGTYTITADSGAVGLNSEATAGTDWRLWAGDATPGSAPFRVDESGNLVASAGTVGGWTLSASDFTGGNATLHSSGYLLLGTSNDIVRVDASDATYRLWVGNATAASAPFRVTKAGALTATTATITGAVTATSGEIGGWDISGNTLQSDDTNIVLDAGNSRIDVGAPAVTDGIRINATGILLYDGGTQKGEWSVDSSWWLGNSSGDKKVEWDPSTDTFYVRGNAAFDTIIWQEVLTTKGSLVVAISGGELFEATTATATTFTVKVTKPVSGGAPFASGDRCKIDNGLNSTWFTVGIGSDQTTHYSYTATYQSGSSTATYQTGTGIADYGQSGDGYHMLTADQSNAPRYSIYTHAGSPWSTVTERLRMGNLNGYLGYSSDVYGMGIGSSSGTNANLTFDPTNGIRLRVGTTNKITLANDGTVTIVGEGSGITNIDGGNIQTNTVTATQIAANTITATQIAAGTITASEIAAGTITGTEISSSTTITAGSGTDVGVLDGADSTYRIYAGHTTPSSANFRVSKSGILTAHSAILNDGLTVHDSTGTVVLLYDDSATDPNDYYRLLIVDGQFSISHYDATGPTFAEYLKLQWPNNWVRVRGLNLGVGFAEVDARGVIYAIERSGDPTQPSAASGEWKLYFKSGGLYYMDDTGSVTGPLGTGGGGALNDLTDVTITSVTDNEVLGYDTVSGNWINQTAAEAGLAAATHTHAASDVNSGTFADARIAQSNVTQHEAALTILETQITDGSVLARVGGNETISGNWTFNGTTVFNEPGGDVDFRVEGVGVANALFVQGSDGFIGINNGAPVEFFHIYRNDTSVATTIRLEQAGTGDAGFQFLLTGVRAWVFGVDNSDADSFKIASSVDVGTDTIFTLKTGGDAVFSNAVQVGSLGGTAANGMLRYVTSPAHDLEGYINGSWTSLSAAGGGDVSVSGTPADDQIARWTDATTIEGSNALRFVTASMELIIQGSAASPELKLYNDTHENTDGGRESLISFLGEKADGTSHTLGRIYVYHTGTGDDTRGRMDFRINNGSLVGTAGYVDYDRGLVWGSPTGGSQGAGTINAEAVYDDGVILTDYVFEPGYDLWPIKRMRRFYQIHKHLPTIVGREQWERNGLSLGKLVSQIWETVEVQARYIAQLEERVTELEGG